ncbi:MAG: hypothetical protein NTY79_08985, partial [Chloroflexi bacterium]|nr:hypothetical protein [Chloroflexota bacterium]
IIERLNQVLRSPSGEPTTYWVDKTPCWEMCHCPAQIREDCPATKYQFVPCWQIEGTYCKLDDYGETGADTSICQVCRVYKKYGGGKPIELKLLGRGIDSSLKSLERAANIDFTIR